MPNTLFTRLQSAADNCRRLAATIDDREAADRLMQLADRLESHLDKAVEAGIGSEADSPPRKWGHELED